MKMLTYGLFLLIALCLAATTQAAPKGKSTILHCGCTFDGELADMQYTEISVNANTRGHDAHVAGSIDSCYAGEVEVAPGVFESVFIDFVRSGDDCQLDGEALGDPIDDCPDEEGPEAGDTCGAELNIQ